jgi:hypothetical protein
MPCTGCQENQLNQLAHMDIGGCLYYDPEAHDWVTDGVQTPESQSPSARQPVFQEAFQLDSPVSAVAQPEPSPVGCVVCISQNHFQDNTAYVRRASRGTMRCRDHRYQCSYCRSPECEDSFLLCDRCSYSGVGSVIHDLISTADPCIDHTASITDGWACGCSRCIQATTSFYVARSIEEARVHTPPTVE